MKPERLQQSNQLRTTATPYGCGQISLFNESLEDPRPMLTSCCRYRLSWVLENPCNQTSVELSQPEAAAAFFRSVLHDEPREVLVAAYLDVRNHVLGWQQAFVGTLSRIAVDPRVILQGALLANADSMLVGHNHPSGDVLPSDDDVAFTERLVQAGEVVGIRLLDHVIVNSQGRWVSLRRRRTW